MSQNPIEVQITPSSQVEFKLSQIFKAFQQEEFQTAEMFVYNLIDMINEYTDLNIDPNKF